MKVDHEVKVHYMDALAAFRVAAAQARDDGMPICAARHEADAAALESAYDLARERGERLIISFY